MPTKDISLMIRSVGLTSGDSFVLGESVRLVGIVGQVKNIQKTDEGYVVEVWRRSTTTSEDAEYEITLVQLQNHAVLWVGAGYLYADSNNQIKNYDAPTEEE